MMMLGVLVLCGGAASAQESYRHGRVLSVDPGVTLQRATEPSSEEASANMPFLPGDRVWTDRGGRAEFQFADGTVLRLGNESKLDYVAHDDGGGDRVVLRLWSGVMYLHNRDGRGYPDFGIETPSGVVEARLRGVFRVDVEAGETRLSVYEGEASLEAEREVRVPAGERVVARGGEATDDARAFDRADLDDFDRWDGDRESRQAYADNRRDYLPEPVLPYAGELESYGAWSYQSEIGPVWRPYVAAAWRPYSEGRWIWTAYGWTWVASEAWGWAPFHYGRWDYTPGLGWYWIPGTGWSPAWVSWAVGGNYVGWCPLGHHDRRVVVGGRRGERGHAVVRAGTPLPDEPWTFVRVADFGSLDLPRKTEQVVPPGHEVHAVEQAYARPAHDLVHVVEGGGQGTAVAAVPRNARPRPATAETTPALRADPATAGAFPVARRRHRDADAEGARPAPSAEADPPDPAAAERIGPSRPPDARPQRLYVPAAPVTHDKEPVPPVSGDREVLRRVFGPLSQPRPADTAPVPVAHPRPAAPGAPAVRPRPGMGETAPAAPRVDSQPAPAAAPAPAPGTAPAPRAEPPGTAAPRGAAARPVPSSAAPAAAIPEQKPKEH